MTVDLELCTDGFHSDECPGCGLTADERDDPANETNSAMNFGEGVASERKRIAEAVWGLHPGTGPAAARAFRAAVLAIIEGKTEALGNG
jgi:hypothetical protein